MSLKWFRSIVFIIVLVGFSSLFFSCQKDESDEDVNFDRAAMLVNWYDNIIIPSFEHLHTDLQDLKSAVNDFSNLPSQDNLEELRTQFQKTWISFQRVKTYEVGPSASAMFKASLNTYPADTVQIRNNFENAHFTFGSVAQRTASGFPAIDFLLHGQSVDLLNNPDARAYLQAVVEYIDSLNQEVFQAWENSRSNFISASGTDQSSSLGQIVNAINQDYELIKNAKIGFPAGKKTLGEPHPEFCEAYFSGISNQLAIANISAIRDLYMGRSSEDSQEGLSLDDYLRALGAQRNNEPLDQAIRDQMETALGAMEMIPQSLKIAVNENPEAVNTAYLEIQKCIVLLKTDMPSAMGVLITYQDNDGD